MDGAIFGTAFATIFLAEFGDKTQLAVLTLAASTRRPVVVFLGAGLALLAVTAVGAVAGGAVARVVPEAVLKRGAAVLFIGIGIWMLVRP